jgi:hypothetical protein
MYEDETIEDQISIDDVYEIEVAFYKVEREMFEFELAVEAILRTTFLGPDMRASEEESLKKEVLIVAGYEAPEADVVVNDESSAADLLSEIDELLGQNP